MPAILKVYAYVTRGEELLAFHEPEVPGGEALQVPGGTVEASEELELAMRRELDEETGQTGATFLRYLGVSDYQYRGHVHRRHFFHFAAPDSWPTSWQNHEKSPSSGGAPVLFEFQWSRLADAVGRFGYDQGALLDRISLPHPSTSSG